MTAERVSDAQPHLQHPQVLPQKLALYYTSTPLQLAGAPPEARSCNTTKESQGLASALFYTIFLSHVKKLLDIRPESKFTEVTILEKSIYKSYDELPLLLNVKQLADLLGVSDSSVYELIQEDGFPSLRIGKRIVIPKEELREWISARTKEVQ